MTEVNVKIGNLIFTSVAILKLCLMFVCLGIPMGIFAASGHPISTVETFVLVMGNFAVTLFFWSWTKKDVIELK